MKFFLLFTIVLFTIMTVSTSVMAAVPGHGTEYEVGIRISHGVSNNSAYNLKYQKLFTAIGQISGDRFDFVYLPPARVKKELADGTIDIEPGVNPLWHRDDHFPSLYTMPYRHHTSIILFKKGKRFAMPTPQHLKGHTIGAVRGYHYPILDPLFASGAVKRFDVLDAAALLESLIISRVDQVVVSKRFADFWIKKHHNSDGFEFGNVIDKVDVMMRIRGDRKSLLLKLDNAIEQLRRRGKIRMIFDD